MNTPILNTEIRGRSCLPRRAGPLAATLTTFLLAACAANLGQNSTTASFSEPGSGPPLVRQQQPTKIALILPTGGFDTSAIVAKAMKQAAEMALFERDDPNVQLIVKNDGGTAEGARAAATLAIADGAEIIIGPLFSKAVSGAAGVARQAGIPVLALSNDARVAGNGVYLMSFLAEQEVDRIVAFAASRGKRQFAALIPQTPYGQIVEVAFRNAVARAQGSVRILETYPVRANAMLKPAKRVVDAIKQADLAGLPIDALFIPGGQETLPHLGPLLAYSGIDTSRVQMLGTGAWEYPNLGREASFVGGWYPGPDPRAWAAFSERFARTFGNAPPRLATLSYDAVGFAISLSASGNGQRFTAANLTRLNGYAGVDGLVRLLPNGRPERSFAILSVQNFGSAVIDPASRGVRPQQVSSVTH